MAGRQGQGTVLQSALGAREGALLYPALWEKEFESMATF